LKNIGICLRLFLIGIFVIGLKENIKSHEGVEQFGNSVDEFPKYGNSCNKTGVTKDHS